MILAMTFARVENSSHEWLKEGVSRRDTSEH